jgi:predicted ribosomally synthesized peptide with nif11-like leader
MRFIAAARSEPALRARLDRAPESGLEPVVRIAAELGFAFTEEDLRAAHKHDWGLRRMRYLNRR